MPRRKRPDITETTTAAAQYRFCASCPVRTGPQLEDDRIEAYCMACPLRGWLLATADMALRARHKSH